MIDKRYKAFNDDWFKRKQNILLYFLNHKVLKIPMRHLLGITEKDVDKKEYICEITPKSFTVFVEKEQGVIRYRSQFYSNDVHNVHIYLNFKQIWLLMHKWDELFADQYLPELSFGFDTLTVYPDADTETDTVDGYCYWFSFAGASFGTAVAGNGSTADDNETTAYLRLHATTTSNEYDLLSRGIALFDCSSLPESGLVVNSATLSAYGQGTLLTGLLGKEDTEDFCAAYTPNINSNTAIIASDYQNAFSGKTVDLGNIDFASLSIGSYNDITLTAAGEDLMKSGIVELGFIFGSDRDGTFSGTWASGAENYFAWWTADYTSSFLPPKLVVDYGAVGGGNKMSMLL